MRKIDPAISTIGVAGLIAIGIGAAASMWSSQPGEALFARWRRLCAIARGRHASMGGLCDGPRRAQGRRSAHCEPGSGPDCRSPGRHQRQGRRPAICWCASTIRKSTPRSPRPAPKPACASASARRSRRRASRSIARRPRMRWLQPSAICLRRAKHSMPHSRATYASDDKALADKVAEPRKRVDDAKAARRQMPAPKLAAVKAQARHAARNASRIVPRAGPLGSFQCRDRAGTHARARARQRHRSEHAGEARRDGRALARKRASRVRRSEFAAGCVPKSRNAMPPRFASARRS